MKSQAQTDAEILSSAKIADETNSQGTTSEIRVRHTRSVHPQTCQCSIHRNLGLRKSYSSQQEFIAKEGLDWIRP